jgi:hypothetical protein
LNPKLVDFTKPFKNNKVGHTTRSTIETNIDHADKLAIACANANIKVSTSALATNVDMV